MDKDLKLDRHQNLKPDWLIIGPLAKPPQNIIRISFISKRHVYYMLHLTVETTK